MPGSKTAYAFGKAHTEEIFTFDQMDLKAGEHIIPVDLVEDVTPQQYIQQLLIQQTGRPRKNEVATFSNI